MCDTAYWEAKRKAGLIYKQEYLRCTGQKMYPCGPPSRFPTLPRCTPCSPDWSCPSPCPPPRPPTRRGYDRYKSINLDNYPTCREPHADGPCSDYIDPRRIPCPPARPKEEVMRLRRHPASTRPRSNCSPLSDCCYAHISDDDDDDCDAHTPLACNDDEDDDDGYDEYSCGAEKGTEEREHSSRDYPGTACSQPSPPCCRPMAEEEFDYWLELYKTFRRHERRMLCNGVILGPRCAYPEFFPPCFDHFFKLRPYLAGGCKSC